MEFEDLQGQTKKEDLNFRELKDFDPKSLVQKSEFLKGLDSQKDIYAGIDKQLKKNKVLREALWANPESRQALITALQAMAKELQTVKK